MNQTNLACKLIGIGAWGPGFNNWPELQSQFHKHTSQEFDPPSNPKPSIIPANERRRAPLPVRAAVEVSYQALKQSGLRASDVACVFGSGLGDTEITDYMCSILASENKQLSPTKFHNSVHNAAAGYWTISSGCMKSANSVAAYRQTAGLSIIEGVTLCGLERTPVLITLFDMAAHAGYKQIFPCRHSLATALLVCPKDFGGDGVLAEINITQVANLQNPQLENPILRTLYQDNPIGQVLSLLDAIDKVKSSNDSHEAQLEITASQSIKVELSSRK